MSGTYALVACFPGCEWNGEVKLDRNGYWKCPGCHNWRQFTPSRKDG